MPKEILTWIFRTIAWASMLPSLAFAQHEWRQTFERSSDVFGTRYFIASKGQYDRALRGIPAVLFGYEHGDERIYLTRAGLVHRFVDLKTRDGGPPDEEAFERNEVIEAEKTVIVEFIGANPHAGIETGKASSHYFTYGGAELNAPGFKSVTYKEMYPHIDIEFLIPERTAAGIKYNIVLHPGARPADVRWKYSGNYEQIRLDENGAHVVSGTHTVTESPPLCLGPGSGGLEARFTEKNGLVRLAGLPELVTEEIIVDPWVSSVPSLTTSLFAYDVDYDDLGNVYVYGGTTPCKLAKYSAAGTLLWTFSGMLVVPNWNTAGALGFASNFVVMRPTGKTYLGQGLVATGARIIRLNASGNYDNFITNANPTWTEVWDLAYHCSTDNVLGLGGTTASKKSGGVINQVTGSITPVAFLNTGTQGHDIVNYAIDNNGEIFWLYASFYTPAINNMLARINSAFTTTVWLTPSTFTSMVEWNNRNYFAGGVVSSNAFNCLAVNDQYLYYYDGLNLAAYNKSNGALIAATTIAGNALKAQGGIAVDDCDNLYLGGNGVIHAYHFTGAGFTALPPLSLGIQTSTYQPVCDIRFRQFGTLLYVSGKDYVGTISAIHSQTCSASSLVCNSTIVYPYLVCGGTSHTVTAPNPQYLTGTTYSILPPGPAQSGPTFVITPTANITYTIFTTGMTTFSAAATTTAIADFTVMPNPVAAPTVTQSTCLNPLSAFDLHLSFVPPNSSPPYSINWSVIPAPVTSNTQSAASGSMAGGTYVATVSAGSCSMVTSFSIQNVPAPASFQVLPASQSVTCTSPVATFSLQPSSYQYTTVNSSGYVSNAINPAVNTQDGAGTYTVYGVNPQSGCSTTRTLAVGVNTVVPLASVSPTFQNINCSVTSVTQVTASTSGSVNAISEWMSPHGGTLTTPAVSLYPPGGPGTYTHCIVDLVNGCRSCRQFSVSSSDGYPAFNVVSPQNFTLGCYTQSVAIVNVINAQTNPPGGGISYTLLAPGAPTAIPSGSLTSQSTYTISSPGTWTVITRDNTNSCTTRVPFSVLMNTVAPSLDTLMVPSQVLSCRVPSMTMEALSGTGGANFNWSFPGSPGNQQGNTIIVRTNTAAPQSSIVASYTLTLTDPLNSCRTATTITVYQNIYKPKAQISGTGSLSCVTESLMLVNSSLSGIPPGFFNPSGFVIAWLWEGPTPQLPLQLSSSYVAQIPGVYTMTAVDADNGCASKTIITVGDLRRYPNINRPIGPVPYVLDCESGNVAIAAIIDPGPHSYTWVPADGAKTSDVHERKLTVDQPGRYIIVAQDIESGCVESGFVEVVTGRLVSSLAAEPSRGFAPLHVSFVQSHTISSLTAVHGIWSFGNGQTAVTDESEQQVSTLYTQPGTYKAMLFAHSGSCADSASVVIEVDNPDRIAVPTIFTPNGDGVNDLFFLNLSAISRVEISIYDRWGALVYRERSENGNIGWKGTDSAGRVLPDGVYFYTITATGNQGNYDLKGNVTLIR
jgi:gliding motility-associated-like protein